MLTPQKITYPRIKPELDRRRKLTPDNLAEMKFLFCQGFKVAELATMYEVDKSTIYYHTSTGFCEKRKAEARKANAIKRLSPEYRKKHRELSNLSHRYKRSVEPRERLFDKADNQNWKIKNPERWRILVEKHKRLRKSKSTI